MQSRFLPTPLSVPARRGGGLGVAVGQQPTRSLECLPCGTVTPHTRGRATYGPDDQLLVQWWKCTLCPEGEAI